MWTCNFKIWVPGYQELVDFIGYSKPCPILNVCQEGTLLVNAAQAMQSGQQGGGLVSHLAGKRLHCLNISRPRCIARRSQTLQWDFWLSPQPAINSKGSKRGMDMTIWKLMGIWNCQSKLLECAFFWSFESIDNISETKRATDDTGDKEDTGDQADHTC